MTARNWHRKSKSGCSTCKKRRIKCDETRPTCLRCKRGGRECEGYQTGSRQPLQNQPVKALKFVQSKYDSLVLARTPLPTSPDESELLCFFLNVTIPSITSYQPCKVWQEVNIKHQLSYPAFKDIAMAIAKHHQGIERSSLPGSVYPADVSGLRCYSKALAATQQLVTANNANLKTVIFANIFLIILECMRDSGEALKVHLLGGLQMLRIYGHKLDRYTLSEFHQIYATIGLSCMVQYLDFEVFKELENLPAVELPTFSPLADFDRLRAATGHTILQTYCTVSKMALGFFKDDMESKSAYQAVYQELDRMDEELQSCLLIDRHTSLATRNLIQAKLLMCRIFLDTSRHRMQMAFDKHYAAFRTIVDLMTEVLDQRTEDVSAIKDRPWSFSFGSGLMIILSFTVTQCRHPQIRREALRLLDMCPRKEGLRSVADTRRIGQAIISYEEEGMEDMRHDYTIPERNRIHFPKFEPPSESNPKSMLYALHRPDAKSEFEIAAISLDEISN